MLKVQAPTTLFPAAMKAKADALAAENNATDESGWVYKVFENEAGMFIVQIFDESGEWVGNL